MAVSFATVLHGAEVARRITGRIANAWVVAVAALGLQLRPFGPRHAYVAGDLGGAQRACLGATWNVSAYDFRSTRAQDPKAHRKDVLWSLIEFERIMRRSRAETAEDEAVRRPRRASGDGDRNRASSLAESARTRPR